MTLHFEEEGDVALPFPCKELAGKVVLAALSDAGCPYEADINILLTTDDEIRAINLEFRGIDRATDVLSFPALTYKMPGDFSFLDEQSDVFHPETGELLLGDIVISKEMVLRQAKEYGHTPQREFSFLIAHSMLHLFGYDHEDEDERVCMEDRQRRILDGLGILR